MITPIVQYPRQGMTPTTLPVWSIRPDLHLIVRYHTVWAVQDSRVRSSVDRVSNSKPVKLRDYGWQASFETTITLMITPIVQYPRQDPTTSGGTPRNIQRTHLRNTTVFRQLVTARITYDAPTRKISVVASYGSTTAAVSYVFNLKALLPQQAQIGLSASTDYLDSTANFDA
ncbi:hypothetical protein ACS0TY_007152 [Phlomoides rotata]